MNRISVFLTAATVLMAAASCAGPARSVSGHSGDGRIKDSHGMCFLGSSGPMINADNTLNVAAQDALRNLLIEISPPEQRSAVIQISQNGGTQGIDQMIIARLRKTLAGAVVAGWWLDRRGIGPRGKCNGHCGRETGWAVACLQGHEKYASRVLPEAFSGKVPSWMKKAGSDRKRICAVGFSGPTQNEDDASANAVDNARFMAATAICGMGDHSFVDYMSGGTWDFFQTRPTSDAMDYVNSLAGSDSETVDRWFDEKGCGPRGLPKSAYARVCVPRPALTCGDQ